MKGCPVHPRATGGEIKTIGLILGPGETHEKRYADWATGRGERCICSQAKKLSRAQAIAHCKRSGGNSAARGRIRRLYDDGGHIRVDPYNGRVVVVLAAVKTSGKASAR